MGNEERYHSIWRENFESYLKNKNLFLIQKIFNYKFEKKYNFVITKYKLNDLGQLKDGNRMRPRIVFWTFLMNIFPLRPKSITSIKLSAIIDACVSIELIHKSSLILDDMIDKDITRKGSPCIHMTLGSEKTSLIALNLITHSMQLLNVSLEKLKIDSNVKEKIYATSIGTINTMSYNAIKDLDTSQASLFNLSKVTEIVQGQVSSLFIYSFLLGYYIGNGKNSLIEEAFIDIGNTLGFLMQLFNDLEPYRNTRMNIVHKSEVHYDFLENQKSIIVGFLGEFLTTKEIKSFSELNHKASKDEFFILKMEKYNVWKFIDEQILLLKQKLKKQNKTLSELGVNEIWYNHFNNLINLMVETAEQRLI